MARKLVSSSSPVKGRSGHGSSSDSDSRPSSGAQSSSSDSESGSDNEAVQRQIHANVSNYYYIPCS